MKTQAILLLVSVAFGTAMSCATPTEIGGRCTDRCDNSGINAQPEGSICTAAGVCACPGGMKACCADGAECPMHKGNSHSSGSERVLTQAQADSCCASSEGTKSNQSNPTFAAAITAAVLGAGIVFPADVPALVLSDGWRTSAPRHVAPVPKHVLLSVFLV